MRAIDADVLKERIRKSHGIRTLEYLLPIEKEMVNEIDNAPTIDIPTWIPCSERLPEERLIVLVSFEEIYGLPSIGITYYNKGKWEDALYREVIAWMPLPMPYKEKTDE